MSSVSLTRREKEEGGKKETGVDGGKEPAGEGEREERHLADVKDDHPLQDNCAWFFSHPLPLIY